MVHVKAVIKGFSFGLFGIGALPFLVANNIKDQLNGNR